MTKVEQPLLTVIVFVLFRTISQKLLIVRKKNIKQVFLA